MKRQAIINLIKSGTALMLFAIVVSFSACKENGEIVPNAPPANLNFVNTSADSLNLYQNGSRLNNISTVSPGSQTGYISIASGVKTYEIKKSGATNYILDNLQLKLDSLGLYSLYVAGETADKVFLVNDSLSATTTGMGEIRFINASASTTNLDVFIGSINLPNVAFKTVGTFTPIAAGNAVVSIYQHGTTTLLFSKTATLTAGIAYTIYSTGVPGGSGTSQFSAVLVSN